MKKIYAFLFARIIRYTPECMRWMRNWFVKKYIKYSGSNINIGRCCKIHKNTAIGNNSGIGYGCEIPNGVVIGNDVMMGPNVIFFTQNHRSDDVDMPMRMQGMLPVREIIIEDNVWIGARVCILGGVTIGTGSIIGACAVVAKSIPPYSVVVGNPAKIVKSRKEVKTDYETLEN